MISRLTAAILLLPSFARAQDAFLARWQALQAAQPAGVSLQVSAPKSEFYAGELIPLHLAFTLSQQKSFPADAGLRDRVALWKGVEESLIYPAVLTDDPLHGLPGEFGGMGGLSSAPVI